MTGETISVIVPTRDSAAVIGPCLASIRAQTWPNVELIVVDNHSSDGTAEIARSLADQVIVTGPERSAQRNRGADAATGSVLVFIDADMTLDPEVLAEVADAMADPEVGQVVLTELAQAEGTFGRARKLEKRLLVGNARVEAARGFRRHLFEAVGGYDEARNAFEDWDLADRIAALGHRTARTTAITWHHEGTVRLREQFAKKRYYGAQSRDYLRSDARRPVGRSGLLAHPQLLARDPVATGALVVLKAVEAAGILLGAAASPRRAPAPAVEDEAGLRVLHVIASFRKEEAMGACVAHLAAEAEGDHHLLAARAIGVDDRFASAIEVGGALSAFPFQHPRRLRAAVDAIDPHVVHVHGGALAPIVARSRGLRGRTTVLSIYHWPRLPPLRALRGLPIRSLLTSQVVAPRIAISSAIPGRLIRAVTQNPDVAGVLTPDPSVAARFAGRSDLVQLVAGGADLSGPRARFDDQQPTVVFAGRAELVRGIGVLVDAWEEVARRRPHARLRLLLLPRADLPAIRAKVAASGARAQIDLVVGATDLRTELRSAQLLVEPFLLDDVTLPPPLTAVEAMSVGLPVVGSDASCVLAALEHGRNGLVVARNDAAALADAIDGLLADPDRWHRLADGARRTAEERYRWSDLVEAAEACHALAGVQPAEARFDRIGERYEAMATGAPGLAGVSRLELDLVLDALRTLEVPLRGARVLDAGAGTGRLTRLLADAGADVTALDPATSMVAALRADGAASGVLQARLGEPLPFPDATFDLAVALRVLKWVPDDEHARRELARVVRPGGAVLLEEANARSLARFGYPGAPVALRTVGEVRRACRSAGLEPATVRGGVRAPHPVWLRASRPTAAILMSVERLLARVAPTAGSRSLIVGSRRP